MIASCIGIFGNDDSTSYHTSSSSSKGGTEDNMLANFCVSLMEYSILHKGKTRLSPNTRYFSRNSENIPQLRTKHDFFKNSFFPSTITEWNNLDPEIRKSKSISIFKSNILKFIRPKPNNVYYCHNPKGIKLLTWLRFGLSHLREHNFKHKVQDCLNSLCLCGNEIETSTHYQLHCPTYSNERLTFLNKFKSINCSILESSDTAVTKILLFGDNILNNSSNTIILNSTIEYIISTQGFEGSILTPV